MNKSIDDWKPEVGMEVYIVPFGRGYSPTKDKISKVGQKYFYVGRSRFFINSKKEDNGDYSSRSKCYLSESDYKRVVGFREKRRAILTCFHTLTDEQVDTLYEWITTNHPQI